MIRALATTLACASAAAACTATGVSVTDNVYKPSEVVAKRDVLRGRTIRMRGYLVLEDEAHGLGDSAQDRTYIKTTRPDPDHAAWGRCVTAYYSESGARAIGRNHPRDVTVVGKIGLIRLGNSIDFGACSDVYIVIEDVVQEVDPVKPGQ